MQTFSPKPPAAEAPPRRRENPAAQSARPGSTYFSLLRAPRSETSRNLHMPAGLLGSMGEAYRTDFSRMRFYESPALSAIHAEALTQGSRSFFAPGRFSPGSQPGRRLIGHELSHAAAQSRGTGAGSGILWNAGLEARADREGALAARGERAVSPNAPAAVAGLRPNVPAQGYFTLLPGDYTLDSDGAKAAFTTHKYVHLATNAPAEPELTAYANEFTAPPVAAGALLPVAAADPGGNTQEMQDLKQSDGQAQLPGNAQLRTDRLRIHRSIADSYAQTLGSANPAFQQNISKAAGADRYAAIGVHRYAGKVALYVADNGAFAVNAQTPEPKEAYMTPDQLAFSNRNKDEGGRGGEVKLVPFPGNRITLDRPDGSSVQLQMVRPSFDGNFKSGRTYDCGDFAKDVDPGVHDSRNMEEQEIGIGRADFGASLGRSGLLAGDRRIQELTDMRGAIDTARAGNDRGRAVGQFLGSYEDVIVQEQQDMLFQANGYQARGRDIFTWYPGRRPGLARMDGKAVTAQEPALSGITGALERQYWARVKTRFAQIMMGGEALGNTPADDIRRTNRERTAYGADDQRKGINAFAQPRVGQAYKITTTLGDGWAYHWGGVVAATATDTLTLENYHKASELQVMRMEFLREQDDLAARTWFFLGDKLKALSDKQKQKLNSYHRELHKTWFFNLQGTRKPGQSFHEKQAATGAYGAASVTMVK